MSRRSRGVRSRSEDGGFTLMEAVVSAGVMAFAAVAVATMILSILKVTSDSNRRTVAADLAAGQAESLRQLSAVDIPDGRVVLAEQTVGGIRYTITQEATYTTYSGTASACQGTGRLAAKRITITVTWDGMGQTRPVTTETMRSLGFNAAGGGLDATRGSFSGYVIDSTGAPVSGVQVVLRASNGDALGTQVTGADGCAVFTNLTAGTNVYAFASRSGRVDISGQDVATDAGSGIVANSVVRSTLQLSAPGTLQANLLLPAGAVMPTSYSATAFRPYLTTTLWPSGSSRRTPPACATASPAQACLEQSTTTGFLTQRLYPAAYGAWVGSCQDARPAVPLLTAVTSGAQATTSVSLAGVAVQPHDAAVVGRTITATHTPDSSCPSGESITLGVMPAMGQRVTVALPPGTWTLSVPSGDHPRTVTLTAGSIPSPVSVG
ncbi:MAG: carboxypeptidase regulatory-like domain-containing protein [Kineosporiaceae bacterium]|nr:carboxypeptidase regulatory-like domain-containing protein [Kineosporiaceae bacterium]